MARYIDADLLLQRLTGVNSSVEQGVKYFNSVYNIINEQPTADVVEVVRCKDCGYYENGKDYAPYCNNVMNLFEEMKPTDYCSYGERREVCHGK